MKVYSRLTGEWFEPNADDLLKRRLARLRNRVWWGILSVSRETLYLGGTPMMITLTYRDVDGWKPAHISEFMKWLRERYGRGYVWVAELQKRGAMHYHVLTSLPEGEMWDKAEIEFEWYYGLVWVTPDLKKPWYLMKYLQKGKQKNGREYPKGARIVGYSCPKYYISDRENNERYASRLPNWLQGGLDDETRKTVGGLCWRASGGYRVAGELALCPYSVRDIPTADEIMLTMSLAHFGRLVYASGGWQLPPTIQPSRG